MQFSLFYFDGDGSRAGAGQYRLLLDSARFADRHGFCAVWTPERHFHAFGGLYPNPALSCAALAMVTERVRLRAGSCVLPLHHPVRVAEDWAVVDNLSGGRVDMAVAPGWTMDEFILSREPHGMRRRTMWQNFEALQRLWAGEAVPFEDADGRVVEARSLPRPMQSTLPVWVTCQGVESFIEAGRRGANVLTSLLGETLEQAVPKIQAYRESLRRHGHDPQTGVVSMMLHTFVGADIDQVKEDGQAPFRAYLRTHYGLLENLAKGMGLELSLEDFSEDDLDSLLAFGVEGFMNDRSLIGTPESCAVFVESLRKAGVDEVACLIDFVQDYDRVMTALPYLARLRERCQAVAV